MMERAPLFIEFTNHEDFTRATFHGAEIAGDGAEQIELDDFIIFHENRLVRDVLISMAGNRDNISGVTLRGQSLDVLHTSTPSAMEARILRGAWNANYKPTFSSTEPGMTPETRATI